jgi:hypothetical protein
MSKSWEVVENYPIPITIDRDCDKPLVTRTVQTGVIVKPAMSFSVAAKIAQAASERIEQAQHAQREWRNDGSARWKPPKKPILVSTGPLSVRKDDLPVKCDWNILATIERWKRNKK